MTYNLSKSKYQSGLQCKKKLWLEINDREKASPLSKAVERIFEQGTEVGIEARKRFPSGLLIEYDRTNPSSSVEKTKEAIKDGAEILFEGAFFYDDTLILADILTKNEDSTWDLIEVKSSTKVKNEHIPDLAIQKYVIEGAGLKVNKTHLMHLNSKCVYPDLSTLFVIEDVNQQVEELSESVPNNVVGFKEVISEEAEPNVAIGLQCKDPHECSFKEYCWEFAGDKAVFDIPSLSKKKKVILQDKGILTLEQLTKEHPLSDSEWEYVNRILNEGIDINKDGIRQMLCELEYPIHFLDFETYNPAIPYFDGMSPYSQFPFQYSCHVLGENGKLDHYEYLHIDNTDPRKPLAEMLLSSISGAGSVVAYFTGFEKSVLENLCGCFPEYSERLQSIIDRLWDQLNIFRYYYKHYAFGGTNSLKSVLPVVVPELSYEDLEVQGGTDAQAVWDEMINTEDEEQKERMIKELKEYCRMDTLAMVEIHRKLLDVLRVTVLLS